MFKRVAATARSGIRRRARARLIPLDEANSPVAAGTVVLGEAPLVIGRGADCDLVCPEPALSRRHARLVLVAGRWRLEDLGSANGTMVAGSPIETVDLESGQVFVLGGRVAFRFELDDAALATGGSAPFRTRFFCPQLVPVAGGRPFVLRSRLTVVGRDETADLRLPGKLVSGIHARIQRQGARVMLRDTGSHNGTAVNGRAVRQSELLPGDRVEFGDVAFAVGVSLWPTGRSLSVLAVGVLLLALVGVLVGVVLPGGDDGEPLWTRAMYEDQVTRSLVAAVKAYDRVPPAREVALAQIDIARRSLVGADRLRPDRQTEEEVRHALTAAAADPAVSGVLRGREMARILDVLARDPAAAGSPPPNRPAYDLGRELSHLVAEFGIDTRDTPIPAELVAEVDRLTVFWSETKRGFTVSAIRRGRPYLEMMQNELRAARLPEIFCYLPFIESGYQTEVTSSVGARGLWQFMPGTARDYGLRVDGEIDERTDPLLATRAACQHLEKLLGIFGPNSFMCAVAAYNKGHNGMRRCLARNGDLQSTWKFWNLSRMDNGCLPRETVEYVPRFLAAVVVFRNPGEFGLQVAE